MGGRARTEGSFFFGFEMREKYFWRQECEARRRLSPPCSAGWKGQKGKRGGRRPAPQIHSLCGPDRGGRQEGSAHKLQRAKASFPRLHTLIYVLGLR